MLLEFDGTFIFALISFIIFVILMNLILYRPIMKIINERQKFLDKNKDTVIQSKQKAADTIQNMEDEILSAKLEASNILSEMQNSIKFQKDSEIKCKKDEIREKAKSHRELLNNQSADARFHLKNEINSFVKMTVSKILEEEISNVNIAEDRINKVVEGLKNA